MALDSQQTRKPSEPLDDEGHLSRFKDWLRIAEKHQKPWRKEAEQMYDLVAGRQWDQEDQTKLEELQRPEVTFNRIGPMVEAVVGTEVNNRQEVRYIPRKLGDAGVNEVISGAAKWARDECYAEDEESHAFSDVVTCGMGWTDTRIETEEDPQGKIVVSRVDPREMRWDSKAKKRNLADAHWVMRIKMDVDIDDAKMAFPEADEEDLHAQWATQPTGDEPHDATQADFYKTDQAETGSRDSRKRITLVEVQWWELEARYLLIDPFDGKKKDLSEKDFKTLEKRINEMNTRIEEVNKTNIMVGKETKPVIEFDRIKIYKKVYKRAFVGNTLLKVYDPRTEKAETVQMCPCPSSFTYKCITGKQDVMRNHWYGIVRSMKDPQCWANKWLSQTMHIMNSNAKGGILAEKDAFENIAKAEEQWADPSAIVWVRPGGLPKIQQREQVQFPVGFDQLTQFAIQSIHDTTGINLNFVALHDKQEPAMLDRQRKQTALTILATMFDALRKYRKEQGKLLLYYITEYLSDGRLIRITEQENLRYIQLIRDPETAEYDIIVDDNPTSPNSKERAWGVILQLLPILQTMQLPPQVIYQLIRLSPLPNSLLENIQKLVENPPPPRPNPLMQAQIQKLIAQAEKDMATASKTLAESQELPTEKLMEAMQAIIQMSKMLMQPPPGQGQGQPGQPGQGQLPGPGQPPPGVPLQ